MRIENHSISFFYGNWKTYSILTHTAPFSLSSAFDDSAFDDSAFDDEVSARDSLSERGAGNSNNPTGRGVKLHCPNIKFLQIRIDLKNLFARNDSNSARAFINFTAKILGYLNFLEIRVFGHSAFLLATAFREFTFRAF